MELPRDQRGFMYADKVLKDGQPGASQRREVTATFSVKCSHCAQLMWSTVSLAQMSQSYGAIQAPLK